MNTHGRGNFIGGSWGQSKDDTATVCEKIQGINPATGEVIWQGIAASTAEVNAAIRAARTAFNSWSQLGMEARAVYLQNFASGLSLQKPQLAKIISEATGKPLWESVQEVETMIGKIANSIEAYQERCQDTVSVQSGFTAVKRFRPHGVVVVLGPFNLPGHLPHSHIVPALLAGNTVVFKPSEYTPSVGEKTTEIWEQAGLPPGVLNLVQGGRNTGVTLASHADLDGLFFTGSYAGGLALSKSFSHRLGKILALELGGNNPLVVWDCKDSESAAILIVQSAFITSGQRCVCARRLILEKGELGDNQLNALLNMLPRLRLGVYTDSPEPFLGPVISATALGQLLAAQDRLVKLGGKIIVPMKRIFPKINFSEETKQQTAFLSPGIIDMTEVSNPPDEEFFGPLLQVFRAPNFLNAIQLANQTRFGLAAGLISDKKELWKEFQSLIRTGVVNWNRQTTGASGKLPFGGIGDSGNHRPSAFFAADYCSNPVASLEVSELGKIETPMGIDSPTA